MIGGWKLVRVSSILFMTANKIPYFSKGGEFPDFEHQELKSENRFPLSSLESSCPLHRVQSRKEDKT